MSDQFPSLLQTNVIRELINEYDMDAEDITSDMVQGYIMGAELTLGKVASSLEESPLFSRPDQGEWTGEFFGDTGVRFWCEQSPV